MVSEKGRKVAEPQDESPPTENGQRREGAAGQGEGVLPEAQEQRTNIAEEFYLTVTERADVREVLRRLANL